MPESPRPPPSSLAWTGPAFSSLASLLLPTPHSSQRNPVKTHIRFCSSSADSPPLTQGRDLPPSHLRVLMTCLSVPHFLTTSPPVPPPHPSHSTPSCFSDTLIMPGTFPPRAFCTYSFLFWKLLSLHISMACSLTSLRSLFKYHLLREEFLDYPPQKRAPFPLFIPSPCFNFLQSACHHVTYICCPTSQGKLWPRPTSGAPYPGSYFIRLPGPFHH